jgi:hypothetical protein
MSGESDRRWPFDAIGTEARNDPLKESGVSER